MDWTVRMHRLNMDGTEEVIETEHWTHGPSDLFQHMEVEFRRKEYVTTKLEVVNRSRTTYGMMTWKIQEKKDAKEGETTAGQITLLEGNDDIIYK